MQMTFRWFGKDLDTVSLEQIKQIPGVVGVVPALHYLPAGEAWEMEDVHICRAYNGMYRKRKCSRGYKAWFTYKGQAY